MGRLPLEAKLSAAVTSASLIKMAFLNRMTNKHPPSSVGICSPWTKSAGEDLGASDVVGEHADEVGMVLGLKQVFEKLGGDLSERLVGGRKHGERAGA
jgi:hypothetical protein